MSNCNGRTCTVCKFPVKEEQVDSYVQGDVSLCTCIGSTLIWCGQTYHCLHVLSYTLSYTLWLKCKSKTTIHVCKFYTMIRYQA